MDILDKEKYIFGSLFLLPNKLQTLLDRELASDGITAKQWFLTAVIEEFFDSPPTLGEVAKVMDTSHQNVKQLALKLQKKGHLKIDKDKEDGRVIRLELTDNSYSFWQQRQEEATVFITEFFKGLTKEEIDALYKGLYKLYEGAQSMENSMNE